MHNLLARQMIGQRLSLRLGPFTDGDHRIGRLGFRDGLGLAGFQFLKPQLELLDLARDPAWCTDQRCVRNDPGPCLGSDDADIARASQLQHAV